jgi:uncharacterized OsmC-like protein
MTACSPARPDDPSDSMHPRPDEDAERGPASRNSSPDRVAPLPSLDKRREASARGQSARPPTRRTLRCRTVVNDRCQQLNHIRNLPPFALQGRVTPAAEDALPTPSEALLAALGSCLAIAIQANAVARAIAIKSLELAVEADCDPSALWGVVGPDGPKPVGFEAIRVVVHVEADAPREVLKTLVINAALWSPVGSTIHDPVHLDVALA